MTTQVPTRKLNSGYDIPLLGLGTYPLNGPDGVSAISQALSLGYRLLDTASRYDNESTVGEAIRRSGVPRAELFVTTKLRGADQGKDRTRAAVQGSLDRLGLDYIDLYLIHWPLPRLGRYVESFQAMIDLSRQGLIRSVGVSNFTREHISNVMNESGVVPAVDQIELSPALGRRELRAYLDEIGIVPQAWSPLGLDQHVPDASQVTAIARERGVTPAQVILRWEVQQGIVAIPKSADPERQRTNLDVCGFTLTGAEMSEIAGLDLGEESAVSSDDHEEF